MSARPPQDRSRNLRDFENNELLDSFRSKNCVSLSTTIAQLYLSEKPDHRRWTKKHTGILCFMKDYDKRSYFFRLFNLNTNMLWEQEMYTPFTYNRLTDNFHHFAADDSIAGFNFSDEDEAYKFYSTVMEKVKSKTERNESKKRVSEAIGNSLPTLNFLVNGFKQQAPLASQPISLNSVSASTIDNHKNDKFGGKFATVGKSKGKKTVISKADISNPTNFRLVQHVGLTSQPALSSNNNPFEITLNDDDMLSQEMRKLLQDYKLPVNNKTKKFMTQFINEHGGVEELKREIQQSQKHAPKPPPPPRLPPSQDQYLAPEVQSSVPPPVPPNPNRINRQKPPPIPPMPPQGPVVTQSFNNEQNYTSHHQAPPPPPKPITHSQSIAPPPPPLPPPLPPTLPPPAPPIPSFTSGPPDPPPVPPPINITTTKPSAPLVASGNIALLDSIRQFNSGALKKTNDKTDKSPENTKRSLPAVAEDSSMLGQLKKALGERQMFLQQSSDEDEDVEDNESDSEWQ